MQIDLFGIVRDSLVIGYMFVLRIGVPLLITLMIGAWLKRLLEEHEEQPETAPLELAPGQHCWDVRPNDRTAQAKTMAAQRPDLPCWLALQVGGKGVQDMCYGCPLYQRDAHPTPAVVKA